MTLAPRSRTSPLALRIGAAAVTVGLWAASSSAWAQQITLLSDNFDADTVGNPPNATRFPTVSHGTIQSGTGFPSQALFFSGNPGGAHREVITQTLDVSGGNGSVQFSLRYTGVGATAVGAFDEMEGGEDITIAYTTDGSTFTTLQTFLATDTSYAAGFVTVNVVLPVGANTTTTQIRWQQTTYNNGHDNWAIDDVLIQADMVAVPEPGTWALYALGATGLLAAVRRRRAAAKSAGATTSQV